MKVRTFALLTTSTILTTTTTLMGEFIGPDDDASHGDPFTPIGKLTVTPTVVQPGVQPEMNWGIEYPQSIPDLVIIDHAGGMLTTNDKTHQLTVRVAGVSHSPEGEELSVAIWVRVGGGFWDLIFYGPETSADPTQPLFEKNVTSGTRVDFAVRGESPGGGWYNTRWTVWDTPKIEAVIDGDPAPSNSSAFSGFTEVESFMTQFIDPDSEIVAGPRDIIHLFEVDPGSEGNSKFDLQDVVLVTTMERNNNGHGNNFDGVDVSNPGQGDGGPNGEEDLSLRTEDPDDEMNIDDERKFIKRKIK